MTANPKVERAETDTPETDAFQRNQYDCGCTYIHSSTNLNSLELARKLERRLHAALAKQATGGAWLILFDDYDRRPEIYTDEAAARYRYKQISISWNAHLFVKVDSNTRDAYVPEPNAAGRYPGTGGGVAPHDGIPGTGGDCGAPGVGFTSSGRGGGSGTYTITTAADTEIQDIGDLVEKHPIHHPTGRVPTAAELPPEPEERDIEEILKDDKSGWAHGLYNCTTGDNYLRSSEYIHLIKELDCYARHIDLLRDAAIGLREERDEQAESHRMQLVAISAATLANTESTIKTRLDGPHRYWTPAYQDVCDAVDREMKLRDQLTACLRVVDMVLQTDSTDWTTMLKAARAAKEKCK